MAYPSDNGVFMSFPSRRSVVHSSKAIVSTISPLANEAGLRILREGGNAADAAVGAAAVLNLVDPSMTGIGGDAFALFYDAKTKKVIALNGSGRSAANGTLDDICHDLDIPDPDRMHGSIPTTSALAVTVPGAAAAWVDIVDRLGSGSVSLEQVLSPAIELAENGCPISEIASYYWVASEDELRGKPNGIELLKKDAKAKGGYRAPQAGEFYRNPLLAETFRRLAKHGRAGFYHGPVAEAIVNVTKSLGGYLTLEDLERHGREGSEMTEPVSIRLGPYTESGEVVDLWEHPPNGQGIVAQMALGILQILEKQGKIPKFKREDHNSPEYLHAVIESLRIAFADATWFIADSETNSTTTTCTHLLSEAYLTERAKLFNSSEARPDLDHGALAHKTSDTVYLAVTDTEGNACSFVNSVADTFGSRIVPPGVGFVLQSRGAGFHLGPPNHPNLYAPGKRPYNTIIPAMVTHADGDAGLHSVLGVMGGAMQPQGHVQVLLNMLLFGMNPQVALDAPRVCIGVSLPGKSTDPSKKVDRTVYLEEGVGSTDYGRGLWEEETARALEAMGHEVRIVRGMGRALFGRGQVICVREEEEEEEVEEGGGVKKVRVYSAGSDMRGDGAAVAMI